MRWKVDREFRDSSGIAWIKHRLSKFDLAALDWITVRRVGFRYKETPNGLVSIPFDGVCKPYQVDANGCESEVYVRAEYIDELTRSGYSSRYRINTRVYPSCRFPMTVRSGSTLRNLEELFVCLIAHEAAHYLCFTEQLPGSHTEENCDAFAVAMLAEVRKKRVLNG